MICLSGGPDAINAARYCKRRGYKERASGPTAGEMGDEGLCRGRREGPRYGRRRERRYGTKRGGPDGGGRSQQVTDLETPALWPSVEADDGRLRLMWQTDESRLFVSTHGEPSVEETW